ncbi:amino acid adenylation domain-containing protein [Micromonospora sp. HM5-17]|uniref:non-ribosomal peptide synthetase n=1 Tax=Micromonospora sp. HM5-17 TaxID=2487710 RepID=UPI0018F5BFA7|nr:non-ribosomal peptide synthetase [Micromonospora sp. HM5-17]
MAEASPAQQGMWLTERAGIAGVAHHLGLCLRFSTGVDLDALVAACHAVSRRHPVLATGFAVEDGAPRPVPAAPPPVLRADLSGDRLHAELRRPFALDTGPLARFVLDDTGPGAVLLVVAHHLVFDGMSKDILLRDLAAAYARARAGLAEVAPGPVRDHTTAAARHRALVAELLPAAREFWREHWREPEEVLLPGMGRSGPGAEPGAAVPVPVPPEIGAALDTAAGRLGATRFELLLATVHALLWRYGNPTPTVAVALSTRTPETADHIGQFVNELPVRLATIPATFRDLVGAVRAELRARYPFRAVPLGPAVGGLRPRTAVAPVSVSYRRRDPAPVFAGVEVAIDWALFPGDARNALNLQVVDDGYTPTLELQHQTAAVSPDDARRIGGHLRTLLTAALADPDRPLAALPLLPADELDRVLHAPNATERAYPSETLPELLARQARLTPDRIAVHGPGLTRTGGAPAGPDDPAERRLSYRELAAVVRRLAERLRDDGIAAGARVAVCLPRSVELLVTLLAVGTAGAAYVPIDPRYPARRRSLILDEAAPRLLVTTAALAPDTGASAPPVLLLDDTLLTGDPGGTAPPAGPATVPAPRPDDLAYVMFTSGSTGRPKGVAVPHRALTNLLHALRETVTDGPDDTWLALTSVGFDISAVELFLPLLTGGRVVVAPDGAGADGARVRALVRRHHVTHLQATPSGWRVLLAAGFGDPSPAAAERTTAADRAAPETERVVALVGGEALPLPLARELRGRVRRLVNVYGPTETTVWSTLDEVPADCAEVTIGRPIGNTRAYLLDGHGNPVPVGIPGELYLGGAGVATGYLNRPELTSERFLPDPFVPGGRMYRTGDLARWLPDGRIAFLGRLDSQVKIRGHRVELGEVEARLLAHPAVTAAAVVLRDEDDDPRLVAYVVSRDGESPDPAALRDHLAGWLPAEAVPRSWVVLDRLPLTPNGKLDRAALPPPPRDEPERRAAPPAPATGDPAGPATLDDDPDGVTAEIRDIWCEVLRRDDVGLDEDLFDLGGHSLTITRIIGRIEQRLGVVISVDDVFDTPTCLGVAAAVRRERVRAGAGGRS